MYKYIVLDFGMVLGYPTTGNWDLTPKFLDLVDISKIDVNKIKSYRKSLKLLSEKIVNLDEEYNMYFSLYKNVLSFCGYPISDDVIREISYDRTYGFDKYRLYDDVVDALSNLSKSYKLLLLSDNWPSVIDFMNHYDIYDLFDRVYVSSIYGQEKKDGLFFDNPINDYDIKPGEALFIDDREKLLDIASSKGFDVLLMDRNGRVIDSKYGVINSLNELEKMCISK